MKRLRQLGAGWAERMLRAGLLAVIFLLPLSPVLLLGDAVPVTGEPHPLTTPKLFAVEILLAGLLPLWWGLRRPRWPALARYAGLALVIAYALISASWALSPRLALVGALHLGVSLGLLVMLTAELRDKRFAHAVLGVFLGSVAIQAGWGLLQLGTGHDLGLNHLGEADLATDRQEVAKVPAGDTVWLRAYGSLPHPNLLAAYLTAAAFLVGTLVLWKDIAPRRRWLLGLLAALFGVGLLATFSRVALLMVLLNGSLVVLYSVRRWHRLPAAAGAALAAFALAALVLWPGLLGRMTLESPRETGVSNRVVGFAAAGQFLTDFPAGVGEQNFVVTLPEVRPGLPAYQVQPVHNVPLLIAAELSLVAAVLVLWFVWRLGAAFHRLRPRTRRDQTLNFGLFALGGAFIILGMFDHFFWSLPQGQWLIAGYAAVIQSRLPA